MSLEIKGLLKVVNEVQQVSEKFKKRDVVITITDGKFPQDVLFQFSQDNVHLVDEFKVGDEVVIGFNLRGREWNGKYFNSLDAWRIGLSGGKAMKPDSFKAPVAKVAPKVESVDEDDDLLPF